MVKFCPFFSLSMVLASFGFWDYAAHSYLYVQLYIEYEHRLPHWDFVLFEIKYKIKLTTFWIRCGIRWLFKLLPIWGIDFFLQWNRKVDVCSPRVCMIIAVSVSVSLSHSLIEVAKIRLFVKSSINISRLRWHITFQLFSVEVFR